jgi:hypothetical protein
MTSVYTNLYYNQPIVVLDTTTATPTSGSLVLYGGFSARGASVLSGITSIINSSESNGSSSGALIISGGVGIQKNLNVGGNVNITGSITSASIETTLINGINGVFTNFTTSNFQADYVRSVAITSGTIIATTGSFSTVSSSFISAQTITAGNLYLSGNLSVAGTITSVNVTTTNIIQTNVTAGVVYVTDSFSAIGNSNTLGSIYTTNGNVGINNTQPAYTFDVNGTSNFTDVLLANSGITTGTLNVTGASLLSGNVTIGSNLIVTGPGLLIPTGDIAARPVTPLPGHIRYNTETSQFEGYGPGSAWGSLGGVVDIAQTTKILASASPSITDGNLYFYTVGSERMRVNSVGNIGIGTSSPNYLLDVNGALGVSTSISTSNLYATNATITNIVGTVVSSGSLIVSGESIFSNNITAGSSLVVAGPALKIPVGNVEERPAAPQQGYIRYNTEYTQFEGYGPGNAWGSLGGVVDIAQTTKILASSTPSVTDGNLYFYTVGSERMRVNSAGNIGIGTTSPSFKLHINGTLGASTSISTGTLYASNALVTNTVDMTPSLGDIIKEVSFTAQNNQLNVANITNLAFPNNTVRSFSAIVSVCIMKSAGPNLYANYDIKGVQKDIGDWVVNTNFIGDNTGIVFNISNVNSKGQIQYISEDLSNWVSTTFKFKATTTSI